MLDKNYNPQVVEDKIYKRWLDNKRFHAEVEKDKEPFTIVIPPPNITGQLHMGHALDNTIQDILIRSKRMQGYNALWVPGTDHASISTEVKIVEKMAQEGLRKEDIGREEFLVRAWDWKETYGNRIVEQLKKMGSSCDWDRERFTMDEGLSKAVLEVFVRLYKEGLIYRGKKLINWCPHCKTTISDAEVDHVDKGGHFWHFKYPIQGTDTFIHFATTRPETMLGDTAVAVNPEDERYAHLVGKMVLVPIVNREIPIIADPYVEKDFGTGVVKITPAHDPNDFMVGERHNLPVINIMNDDGSMNENAASYQGLSKEEARARIVEEFKTLGLFIKVEDLQHSVGVHERCSETIEPLIKMQWFVKMEELAKPAIDAYKSGELRIIPERFGKIYLNWLENIKDWCISRQLWWGHRIPAYYCSCGKITVSTTAPACCSKCGGSVTQDEDTLDTWFSSALWPFSTLGWPDHTPEFAHFYPTSVLVTAYDIIFFWVVRMVFSGLHHTGKLPFKDVLIHGIIRDSEGRKMSKSLGNGIDPLEIIQEYGADALRLTLILGTSPGNDSRFYMEKVLANRNFLNKVWNATRFILMNCEDAEPSGNTEGADLADSASSTNLEKPTNLSVVDKWILSRVNTVAKEVTDNLNHYEIGLAIQKVFDFVWDEFCDWYIEMVKPRLYNKEDESRASALWTLKDVLIRALKLLHPFLPFITEEIFCSIQTQEDSIMCSPWPFYDQSLCFLKEEKEIELIKESVSAIRNLRTEMNVPPSKKVKVIVSSAEPSVRGIFERGKVFFQGLAFANQLEIVEEANTTEEGKDSQRMVSVVIPGGVLYMPFAELVDISKEIQRLNVEKTRLLGEIERVDKKLQNEGFVAKAPAKVIEEEKEKREKYSAMLAQAEKQLEALNGVR